MSQVITLILSFLSFFSIAFLLIGMMINIHQQKGFSSMFEMFLFIGVFFSVFILGMVAFSGAFIL